MHSYETLAILILALSAAFPAISAPVRENQQQARANVDERGTIVIPESSDGANTTPAFVSGHYHDQRAPGIGSLVSKLADKFSTSDSFGTVLGKSILSGVSSGAASDGVKKLLNATRRDFDENSGIDSSTPTKVFGHSIGVLPVIPPVRNSTTTFSVPGHHERSLNVGSTPGHSLDTLVSDLNRPNFNNHIISGRSVRRDPSLFDLSGVLHFLGPVLSYGGFGPGDASSGIIRRDGPLDPIDHIKELISTLDRAIH